MTGFSILFSGISGVTTDDAHFTPGWSIEWEYWYGIISFSQDSHYAISKLYLGRFYSARFFTFFTTNFERVHSCAVAVMIFSRRAVSLH